MTPYDNPEPRVVAFLLAAGVVALIVAAGIVAGVAIVAIEREPSALPPAADAPPSLAAWAAAERQREADERALEILEIRLRALGLAHLAADH